ncbi:hypothetical protein QA600_15595 [Natronococcus sp. A-GB1]|uniref:hypothetical protein n=1 Tax=Natronococcus sp. A-GB1 TaxID=3037648 RepID=UPI00241F59E3|nr:hypothetical protein [Natronococcus sp. A-GB1]MDG5760761.1 hypothetical protein [Natronococcus sp. A-GB1]
MKGPGILWMLQTAAGFSLAGPLFFLAANYLFAGRYAWGVSFLFFGLLVLYFPTYLVNRIGGPRAWVRRRLGRGGDDETEDDSTAADGGTDADRSSGTDRGSPLERLRSR